MILTPEECGWRAGTWWSAWTGQRPSGCVVREAALDDVIAGFPWLIGRGRVILSPHFAATAEVRPRGQMLSSDNLRVCVV